MSQFAPPGEYQGTETQKTETSKLAIASLVCSLILCCPVTTILGVLLGIGGVVVTGANSALRGRGLALAGLILGLVFTGGQIVAGNWGYTKFAKPVIQGPADALIVGAQGDLDGFRDYFTGKAAKASDAEVKGFLDALQNRYGAFRSLSFDDSRGQQQQTQGGRGTFPYLLEFADASVEAEAELIFADEATGQLVMKWNFIEVFDDELGDMVFPSLDGSTPNDYVRDAGEIAEEEAGKAPVQHDHDGDGVPDH